MKLNLLGFLRVVVPLTFLLTTGLLLWRHQYPLPPDAQGLLWLSRLDPLLLITQWQTTGALPMWFWLPLGIIVLTIFFGRIFCGWVCPIGGLLTLIPNCRKRLILPRWIYDNRYFWQIFLLSILLVSSNWPLFLSPFHLLTEELTRLMQGKIPWLLAGMVFAGIIFFPRVWCVYICPTGLLLAAISRCRPLQIIVGEECIECGVCRTGCRTQAIVPRERRVSEDCMLCGRCWQTCPEKAVHWQPDTVQQQGNSIRGLSRRNFFKGGAAVAVASLSSWKFLQITEAAAVIRPPGALSEADFLAVCSRCGRCVKVCPSECLFPMPLEAGFTAFLTPMVIPRRARCDLCMLCQEVCPTGAISQVPLEMVKMGVAELDRQRCLVWSEQKICLLCREQCPVHAVEVDQQNRPYVDESLCVGCGACENGCPLGTPAITVRPLESNNYK